MIHEWVSIIKRHVLNDLKSNIKISLTLNTWISENHLTFLEITAYFIDKNWQYCEVLLAFYSLHGVHSDAQLTQAVLIILKRYQIQIRLLAITADNAKNNDILRYSLTISCSQKVLNETSLLKLSTVWHMLCN